METWDKAKHITNHILWLSFTKVWNIVYILETLQTIERVHTVQSGEQV